MSRFTVRLELDTRAADHDRVLDALADYQPTAAHSLFGGRTEVTITVPGDNLRQAITTALAVTEGATGFDVFACEAMPADEHTARQGYDLHSDPELLSVNEAAIELGVSSQRIRQRLDAGQLGGVKVGGTWIVPRYAVQLAQRAAVPGSARPAERAGS